MTDFINKVFNEDYKDYVKRIPNESIDNICTDVPYGVLGNHKIETELDKEHIASECYRMLKPDTFCCIFGQQPTIVDWQLAFQKYFTYKDEITWVKRSLTAVYLPICRQKETILIFAKGNPKYFETKGKYEDIKVELLKFGLLNYESIKTYISNIIANTHNKDASKIKNAHRIINDKYQERYSSGGDRAPELANVTNVWAIDYSIEDLLTIIDCYQQLTGISKDEITTVWSYKPHNLQQFGKDEFNIKHPTTKPIELMQRLLKLTCKPNGITVDMFGGSGTSFIAAKRLEMNYSGCEILKEYYDISESRLAKPNQPKQNTLEL